jgi:hypothetical protein
VAVQALARSLVRMGITSPSSATTTRIARSRQPRSRPPEPTTGSSSIGSRAHRPIAVALTQQTGRPIVHGGRCAAARRGRFDVIHFHNLSLVGGPAALAFGAG